MRVAHELTTLYLQYGPFVLVHGAGGTGVDAAAHHWMETAGLDLGCFEVKKPADFKQHGKHARSIRDKEMVKTGADLALVFVLEGDEEAKQMLDMAREAGIPAQEIVT